MNTETTTVKTIEHLKAELEIAEQKLREEEEAIARQEREVEFEAQRIKREAEEKAHMEKMAAFAVHIVGELKKVGFDPIFSLNHTYAMFRAHLSRLIRKTWNTTKKPDRLADHLAIYALIHNQRLLAKAGTM